MAQPLLIAHPHNASIEELKQVSRVGSNETATRCSAIQMLLAGADRQLVCNALLVTNILIMDNASCTNAKPPIGTIGSRCICHLIRLISTP